MARTISHFLLSTVILLVGVRAASAQTESEAQRSKIAEEVGPTHGFVEAGGSWGFALGPEPYVPNDVPGNTKHPITQGFGSDVTAGYEFLGGLAVIVDYSYAQAESRRGSVIDVLDRVRGRIRTHSLTTGLRLSRWLGIGRLYGELAVGVVFPFKTRLKYTYAPEMSELGVMGQGVRRAKYNAGVGAHGELGYQFRLWNRLYLAPSLRVRSFQSNNQDRSTRLDNFVTDFDDPVPVTTTIDHSTRATRGDAAPETYSVQDIRLFIEAGYWF